MRRAVAGARVPLPLLYEVLVVMMNRKKVPLPREETIRVPVLLPSVFLSWMWNHHRSMFMKRVVGSEDGSSEGEPEDMVDGDWDEG